ncbi:MAG: hypothetical protein H6728_01540 [Myxococcales bacterium]|nr:hypothetical protein [Myxococcales bacterium]
MFTRSFFFSLLLLLGAALQYGCTGPECPGKQGCTCDTNTPCNSGLTCQGGTCAAAGETTQESGPAEVAPEDAGPTERCEPGTAGCRCMAQESCQTGLRCEKSVCVACTEGSAGCPCKSGGACDNGLTCENNLCSRCEGKAYCACYKNNSCDVGQRCESNTNGNNTCKPCSAQGEQGCNCEKDGDCSSALLCVNKRCQPESALAQIPKEPKCYTPCTGNIRDRDGTIRICHPNLGLMEGCQVGQTCQNGSCVGGEKKGEDLKASAYPYCMSDENCPSWQRCIQGRCYSNCKVNSECPNGMGCYAYVCRQKCDLRKTECSPDETCQNVGSTQEEGFCLPSPAPQTSSDTLTNTVKEVFLVSSKELSFTNREKRPEIALTNQSEYPLQVKITRESDTTGESKPLSWLTVDVCQTYTDTARSQCQTYTNKPTAQEPFSVEVPAKGRVILKILGAEQVPQQKLIYSGVLRIQSGETKQRLDVRYRRSTNGRWQGKIHSFGNFDDTQISQFPGFRQP